MILSRLIRRTYPSLLPVYKFKAVSGSLLQPARYYFSEKDNKSDKKGVNSQGEISLSDVWESISSFSQRMYEKGKRMSKVNWAVMLGLCLVYYLSKQ